MESEREWVKFVQPRVSAEDEDGSSDEVKMVCHCDILEDRKPKAVIAEQILKYLHHSFPLGDNLNSIKLARQLLLLARRSQEQAKLEKSSFRQVIYNRFGNKMTALRDLQRKLFKAGQTLNICNKCIDAVTLVEWLNAWYKDGENHFITDMRKTRNKSVESENSELQDLPGSDLSNQSLENPPSPSPSLASLCSRRDELNRLIGVAQSDLLDDLSKLDKLHEEVASVRQRLAQLQERFVEGQKRLVTEIGVLKKRLSGLLKNLNVSTQQLAKKGVMRGCASQWREDIENATASAEKIKPTVSDLCEVLVEMEKVSAELPLDHLESDMDIVSYGDNSDSDSDS